MFTTHFYHNYLLGTALWTAYSHYTVRISLETGICCTKPVRI